MSDSYFYSILVYALFIPVLICIRYFEKSWFTPATIFALLWFAIIGISVFSAPDYYFSPQAILFIIVMVTIFFIAGLFSARMSSHLQPELLGIDHTLFRKMIIPCFLAGMVAVCLLVGESSEKILINKTSLLQIANEFTKERYAGVRLSSTTMFFLMINYYGCLVAGTNLVNNSSKKIKLFQFIILVPLVIFTILYTARAVFLYGAFLLAGSFLAGMSGRKKFYFKRSTIAIFVSTVLLIPIIFIVTQALRMGVRNFSLSNLIQLVEYLKVWFAGNISSFGIWYDQLTIAQHANGQYTFGGVFEILGLSKREVGIYTVAYDVNGKMVFTNIYTLFRFLIDDFGIVGAILFIAMLGFVAKKFSLNQTRTSKALLSGIFALLLFSFISSIWAYNTVLFAWILFVFTCFVMEYKFLRTG